MENTRFSTGIFAVGDRKNAKSLISDVFNGKLKAIEIRNFLTNNECDEIVELLEQMEMDAEYLGGQAGKIGVSAHNCQSNQAKYFSEAESHPMLSHPKIVQKIGLLLDVLSSTSDRRLVETAINQKREAYSPTVIREFHSTLKLHNDFAPREQKGWYPIQNVRRQFAYVIKLSSCMGGETYFYPTSWQPCHELFFNHEDNYSYDMEVVAQVPEFKIDGPKGSLIIFDCSNYHRVANVTEGKRYTMGGFIGELPDNQFVVWS